MKTIPSCSIVIPVYNGAAQLPELVTRLEKVLTPLCQKFEILLVNDGSPDHSWTVINQLLGEHPHLIGINLMRNYGQHNATLCGVRAARCEIIVTMDDDLQHPPEEIPVLLAKLMDGADVVYGFPKKMPHSWWRNFFSRVTKKALAWVMGVKTIRDIGAFRAFRSELCEAFAGFNKPDILLDVLLSWGTSRFATVEVNESPREQGKSNYTFSKLVNVFFTVLTSYSTAPLRFASMVGLFFTLVGFVVFLYVLGIYFFAGSIPGFPFLASIISVFSGVQLFALGLIGEYLAKVFERTMDRPAYVIREQYGYTDWTEMNRRS